MSTILQGGSDLGTRASSKPVLSIKNLRVSYTTGAGTVNAVDGVSLDIGAGEIFGLAGESGCGKSTIANAVMRLLQSPAKITDGTIELNQRNVLTLSDEELRRTRWREMSMVFQSAMNAMNPVMTIGEQMMDVFTTHEKMPKKEARERAAHLLTLVDITPDRLKAYPHQLSGGMRQRVVIAIALALNPSLLIMDEPTTALDVVVQRDIMAQIKELQQSLGFSVLFITHDISLMVELSHRMAVMYAGRLVEVAPSNVLLDDPLHPYTTALMNAFPPLSGPRTELLGLPDAPPTSAGRPSGCSFHPRCPMAMDACKIQDPVLRPVAEHHDAACLLVPEFVIPSERPAK
ncbi:MAG: ABC transporter ATP-binding protein [Acidobacteria bacterium]|nr:ABC transporter ATP-binding protein [Acidobacteriota bacterium]